MRRQSFRSIIIVSLILVISITSFAAFSIYSNYLGRKIYADSEKNIVSTLSTLILLEDQYYNSVEDHDRRIIEALLEKMDKKEQVLNSYFFNSKGVLKYSLYEESMSTVPVESEELSLLSESVSMKSFPSVEYPFSRIYFQLKNSPTCYECHQPEEQNLGFIVIDKFLKQEKSNPSLIRNSSMLFSLMMIAVILSFVLLMHYKFVRKSLREFNNIIKTVNQGNLKPRLTIPETKELGLLGNNFNEMLDSFQKAQKQLVEFHKKELRSNYKLATIGEMAARLAHEIRNPITGIANAIEIIVAESNDQQNIPILEEVRRQAKRVNDAISDLLKYSRKKELNLVMNNINDVINQLVFFIQNQVQYKEIEFLLDLQEEIPHLRFDQQQIEDVLLNLGLNAIEAIHKKGTITFITTYNSTESKIYIHIKDTGKGIPKENLSNIFHPFFTTRNEGTGLGLAIVKDVIDKHEGEIWVENNKESGCTFTISLPVEL